MVKEKTSSKVQGVFKGVPLIANIYTDNFVYIMIEDRKGSDEIRKFDSDFLLIDKYVIEYGQGPNECLSPLPMGGYPGNILIYDEIVKKYYFYNADFSARKTLDSRGLGHTIPYGSRFSEKQNVLVTAFWEPLTFSHASIAIYARRLVGNKFTDKKIYNSKLIVFITKELFLVGQPFHFKLIDNFIYLLKSDEYNLIKMDLDGNIVKQITIKNFARKTFSRQETAGWIKEVGGMNPAEFTFPSELWPACWIFELPNGFAVGRRNDYKPDKGEWIECDYFNKDLDYLGKIKVPWFRRWNNPIDGQRYLDYMSFLNDGKFYFVEYKETETDEEYYLTRWRIEEGTASP